MEKDWTVLQDVILALESEFRPRVQVHIHKHLFQTFVHTLGREFDSIRLQRQFYRLNSPLYCSSLIQ